MPLRCRCATFLIASLLIHGIGSPAAGGPLIDRANEMYNGGRLIEAIKMYKRAGLAGENPALCYFNAANAYYQLDSLPQAVVLYKACVSAAPGYAKGFLNLAIVYYALNDVANCIGAARRYCDLDTANQKGRLLLAYAYRSAGDLPNAVLTLEDLAQDHPQLEEPYIALGEIFNELADDQEAMRWFMAYPASGKNIEYVYCALADLSQARGDIPKALYYLQTAYSVDKTKKRTLYRIAALQQRMGNDLVAYETAREGMSAFPDFPDIAVLAGNLAFSRQRLEEAQQCYAAAYKLGSPAAVIGLENVRAMREKMLEKQAPPP